MAGASGSGALGLFYMVTIKGEPKYTVVYDHAGGRSRVCELQPKVRGKKQRFKQVIAECMRLGHAELLCEALNAE